MMPTVNMKEAIMEKELSKKRLNFLCKTQNKTKYDKTAYKTISKASILVRKPNPK